VLRGNTDQTQHKDKAEGDAR